MNRILLSVLLSVLALGCLASCAVNPVSGERELALMPESQEIEIGRQTALAAENQLGLVDDPQLQDYVQRLGAQLAAASSSSRAEGKAMRPAFDCFASGAQVRTSMPCFAQASRKSCI